VLALGLSFGLGGRDVAGKLLQKWYDEGRQQASRIAEAGENAETDTPRGGGSPARGFSDKE